MTVVSGNQMVTIGKTAIAAVRQRDLTGMAQQIAYNVLFALGPLLIFVTAFAGFLTQRINSDAENPVLPITNWMNENLPDNAASFLREPVESALNTSPGFLLSFGALLALWGARNAVSILMKGLNLALGVEETRSWFRQQVVSVGLTIATAFMLVVSSLLFVLGTSIGTDLADSIGLGELWATVSVWLRWPVIALVIVIAVALLNRFAPDHAAPLRWYLPGAALTVVLWGLSLVGLRLYFEFSGSYAEAYGVFGAVLAFVFWLYIMSLVVLIGGVVNSAVQREIPAAEGEILSQQRVRPAKVSD